MNRREEKQTGSSRDFRKSTNLMFVFFRKYGDRPPTATDRCCCTGTSTSHFSLFLLIHRSSDTTRALQMQAIKCVVVGDG